MIVPTPKRRFVSALKKDTDYKVSLNFHQVSGKNFKTSGDSSLGFCAGSSFELLVDKSYNLPQAEKKITFIKDE